MKILVTGGCGFIGSHLVDKLIKTGHYVIVFDNLFRGNKENIEDIINHPNLKLIIGDINDEIQLDLAFKEHPELIYHLAAINGTKYFYEIPDKIIEINLHGTKRLIDKCNQYGIKRIIFASTSEVYGNPVQFPTPEDASVHFDAPQVSARWSYALCKYLDEVLLLNEFKRNTVKPVIIRYFNV